MIFLALASVEAVVWYKDGFVWTSNNAKEITIYNGQSAEFVTGAFTSGENIVHMDVDVLTPGGYIVSHAENRDVDVSSITGYEEVTINSNDYHNSFGTFLIRTTLSDDFPDQEVSFITLNVISYASGDNDNDGVDNSNDNCANTPQGEFVNAEGCSCSQLSGYPNFNDGNVCTTDFCESGIISHQNMNGNYLWRVCGTDYCQGNNYYDYPAIGGYDVCNDGILESYDCTPVITTNDARCQTIVDYDFTSINVNANPTSGNSPLTVSFSCSAVGGNDPITYLWDFGDGTTSSNANPSHTYTVTQDTTFSAACTAYDSDSDAISGLVNVVVLRGSTIPGGLTVGINAVPRSGNSPLTVQFTSSVSGGTGPYTYSWSFGDGATSSDINPSHIFVNSGNYLTRLTVRDSIGREGINSVSINVTKAGGSVSEGQDGTYGFVISGIRLNDRVNAGDKLDVSFELKNKGDKIEKNIKVEIRIPELNIIKSLTIDQLDSDEKLWRTISLTIPKDTKTDVYSLSINAKNNGYSTSSYSSIDILGKEIKQNSEIKNSTTEKAKENNNLWIILILIVLILIMTGIIYYIINKYFYHRKV